MSAIAEFERNLEKLRKLCVDRESLDQEIQEQRSTVIEQMREIRTEKKISLRDMEYVTENHWACLSRMEHQKDQTSNNMIIRAATGLLWIIKSND